MLLVLVAVASFVGMPEAARADTDLVVGGRRRSPTRTATTRGLRSRPRLSGPSSANPEGSDVEVLDGPVEADDGSLWYKVADRGQRGYMIADYLPPTRRRRRRPPRRAT